MPLVAELVTKLETNTSNFNKGLNDSENRLSKFSGNAAKAGAAIALAIGTVAVGGFIKLLNVINDTEEQVSKLVDTATKFDTSVAGLQKLDYIAKLSGGSLADVEAGMSKIVLSLKALDEGSKGTAKAFEQLGISQSMLAGLKVDEVYLLVAERLKGIKDSTEQAKIASEIFGRSWSSQINIVKSDITGLSAEFTSFGGALTSTQAAAIDRYGDSVTRLGALFETFKLQLTAQAAPALEEIVKWVMTTTQAMGGLGPVASTTAQYFISGLQMVVSTAQRVVDIINAIEYGFKSAQLQMMEFMQSFSELNFEVFGNDLNFERLDAITKLKRDLEQLSASGRVTDPLQQGLQKAQQTLQGQPKQTIEVKISTEKGLTAEIAGSQELADQVNKLILGTTERSN